MITLRLIFKNNRKWTNENTILERNESVHVLTFYVYVNDKIQ